MGTYGQHVQKQWSLPAVTVGRPSGSIKTISGIDDHPCQKGWVGQKLCINAANEIVF